MACKMSDDAQTTLEHKPPESNKSVLALHIGLNELRGHQFHRVPKLRELPRPVMRPTRGFHADETRRQLGDKRQHFPPGEPLLHDDVPMRINAMDTHHILCDIDAYCCRSYWIPGSYVT